MQIVNNARMSLPHLKLFELKLLIAILDFKHETAAPEVQKLSTVSIVDHSNEYHIALFSHFSDNPIDMHCKLPKYSTLHFFVLYAY